VYKARNSHVRHPDMAPIPVAQMAEEYVGKAGPGRAEFAYLSALLNVKPAASDNFKLNLFGDDDGPLGGLGCTAQLQGVTCRVARRGGAVTAPYRRRLAQPAG
jgi:hypothetical protein